MPVMLIHCSGMVFGGCLLVVCFCSVHFNAVRGMRDHVMSSVGLSVCGRLLQRVLLLVLLVFKLLGRHIQVWEGIGRGGENVQPRGISEVVHVTRMKVYRFASIIACLHPHCQAAVILDVIPILMIAIVGREIELQVAKLEEIGEVILRSRDHGRPGRGGLHMSGAVMLQLKISICESRGWCDSGESRGAASRGGMGRARWLRVE